MRDFISDEFTTTDGKPLVAIYKLETKIGVWYLLTTRDMFHVQRASTTPSTFYLMWSNNSALKYCFGSISAAANAVRGHMTTVDEWDESDCLVADGVGEWSDAIPENQLVAFVETWIAEHSDGSLRELDRFFDREKMKLVSRPRLVRCLKQMIVAKKLHWLPYAEGCPSEMKTLVPFAEAHGIPVRFRPDGEQDI